MQTICNQSLEDGYLILNVDIKKQGDNILWTLRWKGIF